MYAASRIDTRSSPVQQGFETWWLAAAWALHPIWDMGLHYFGPGSAFVHPLRYPVPCLSFDLIAAYIAYRTWRESTPAVVRPPAGFR